MSFVSGAVATRKWVDRLYTWATNRQRLVMGLYLGWWALSAGYGNQQTLTLDCAGGVDADAAAPGPSDPRTHYPIAGLMALPEARGRNCRDALTG